MYSDWECCMGRPYIAYDPELLSEGSCRDASVRRLLAWGVPIRQQRIEKGRVPYWACPGSATTVVSRTCKVSCQFMILV